MPALLVCSQPKIEQDASRVHLLRSLRKYEEITIDSKAGCSKNWTRSHISGRNNTSRTRTPARSAVSNRISVFFRRIPTRYGEFYSVTVGQKTHKTGHESKQCDIQCTLRLRGVTPLKMPYTVSTPPKVKKKYKARTTLLQN